MAMLAITQWKLLTLFTSRGWLLHEFHVITCGHHISANYAKWL